MVQDFFLSWNMFKTTCRNGLKRLRIACTACVLWIDVTDDGSWLCICKGGSTIGIVLKIRCKTKCDKTLQAGKVYIENSENNRLLAQVNIKDSISANNQSLLNSLHIKNIQTIHNINKRVWWSVDKNVVVPEINVFHVGEACFTTIHVERQQTVNDSWSSMSCRLLCLWKQQPRGCQSYKTKQEKITGDN